jgi:hypothetical protein
VAKSRTRWVATRAMMGFFSLRHGVQTGYGAQPASYPMDNEALTPGVKRPGREADHSPPASTEVNAWNYISTPSTLLHGVVLSET